MVKVYEKYTHEIETANINAAAYAANLDPVAQRELKALYQYEIIASAGIPKNGEPVTLDYMVSLCSKADERCVTSINRTPWNCPQCGAWKMSTDGIEVCCNCSVKSTPNPVW